MSETENNKHNIKNTKQTTKQNLNRKPTIGYHIVERSVATKRNPCSQWSFSDEDNMMKLGKVSKMAHGNTVGRGGLRRWIMQFFEQ